VSTNYYLKPPVCLACGLAHEPLHIGKSSVGWAFSLHVYPEFALTTWPRWREYLYESVRQGPMQIVNEYGDEVPFEEMVSTVTNRKGRKITPEEMQAFCDSQSGWAVPGPYGLARHRVDGRYCIGHGKGTWDYLIGEFS
jgi:hypothetical protein